MSTVKVGQVWQDKDKRRNTRIEIIEGPWREVEGDEEWDAVRGLIVGTEEEREYKVERLTARWTLIEEKAEVIDGPELIEQPKPKHKNREAWLEAGIKEVSKLFAKQDFEVPTVRVSVGWPGGRGKKQGVIGQCFATTSATDKVAQIFVSPVVDRPLEALIVVAHELIHAVDDCKSKHKSGFIKIAKAVGFVPKWTVATPETVTDDFREQLEKIAEKLGTYPHAAILPTDRPKVQKTYMLKVLCVEDDEFFVRMTQSKLDDFGAPLCPCHKKEMEVEEK